jgi:hypothetical protein
VKEILSMNTAKTCSGVLTLLAALTGAAYARDEGAAAIQTKLESEYQLTKTTADNSGIVTAGSFLVLHKDKVLMFAVSSSVDPCMNTYRGGKVTQSTACKLMTVRRPIPIPGSDKMPTTRSFVTGENFWVTRIDVKNTNKGREVVFDFFSDAIADVHYRGALTIPLGPVTPDEAVKVVAEVITVAPAENAKDDGKAQSVTPAAAPPPPDPAPPPIEPPPPAPPAPPEPAVVSEGQTIDQVVAALGQPLGKFKAGTKEIYTYRNLKVIFVDGKVKDVE